GDEVGPLALEHLDDLVPGDHRPKWGVAAADALRGRDQVRHHTPVVDPEGAPGAAEAGHYLVGNEQHLVAVADLPDALEVALGRGNRPQSGTNDGLSNEGRDVLRPLAPDLPLQRVGTVQCAARAVGAVL